MKIGRGGKVLMKLLHGLISEGCKLETRMLAHVRGNNSGTASIGDNGDLISLGDLLGGKGLGIIKKFINSITPYNTCLSKNGIINNIGTGKGAGVGCCRLGTGIRGTGFDCDDRGGIGTRGHGTNLGDKLLRVPGELLHIDHHHIGVGILVVIS